MINQELTAKDIQMCAQAALNAGRAIGMFQESDPRLWNHGHAAFFAYVRECLISANPMESDGIDLSPAERDFVDRVARSSWRALCGGDPPKDPYAQLVAVLHENATDAYPASTNLTTRIQSAIWLLENIYPHRYPGRQAKARE